ncbi:unnamed protein product, partial [Rotaria sp. Silwood1]
PTPSLIILLNNSSSSNCQFHLKRQSSVKSVMITDVDRLETGVIELENVEPGKE